MNYRYMVCLGIFLLPGTVVLKTMDKQKFVPQVVSGGIEQQEYVEVSPHIVKADTMTVRTFWNKLAQFPTSGDVTDEFTVLESLMQTDRTLLGRLDAYGRYPIRIAAEYVVSTKATGLLSFFADKEKELKSADSQKRRMQALVYGIQKDEPAIVALLLNSGTLVAPQYYPESHRLLTHLIINCSKAKTSLGSMMKGVFGVSDREGRARKIAEALIARGAEVGPAAEFASRLGCQGEGCLYIRQDLKKEAQREGSLSSGSSEDSAEGSGHSSDESSGGD